MRGITFMFGLLVFARSPLAAACDDDNDGDDDAADIADAGDVDDGDVDVDIDVDVTPPLAMPAMIDNDALQNAVDYVRGRIDALTDEISADIADDLAKDL